MPKPVLSDSLFNADDVATAVIAEANLQIANNALAVTNVTSNFVRHSNWNAWLDIQCYKFNGFVFVNLSAYYTGSNINSDRAVYTINDSNLYPNASHSMVTLGYQGDTASNVQITTSGDVYLGTPVNLGDGEFYFNINGWYRL